MQQHSPSTPAFALDAHNEHWELQPEPELEVERSMGRRRRRNKMKNGTSETGPATGERFRLIRPRTRARKRGGDSVTLSPSRPAVQPSASASVPSFVGGGVPGRARYLFDSMLRLTRDRIVIVLLLVVVALYLITRVLAKADSIAQEALAVYRGRKEAQFAPFKLLADVLDQFCILKRVVLVLRGNALMLDAAIRAVIPAAVPFAARFVQAALV